MTLKGILNEIQKEKKMNKDLYPLQICIQFLQQLFFKAFIVETMSFSTNKVRNSLVKYHTKAIEKKVFIKVFEK